MKKGKQNAVEVEILWQEEKRRLTLEGEPVLEYTLAWPEVRGGGLGGRWINRYYTRLAQAWRLRWQREVYWKACLELAACRAVSRPFTPWQGRLGGEVALLEGGLLSLRLEGEETRGGGRSGRVRWGDVWKVQEGAPCSLKEIVGGGRGWRKGLVNEVLRQGRGRRKVGDFFLDGDWEKGARTYLPYQDFCLTPEGVELAYPQCTIAPAAEGTPVFVIPRALTSPRIREF